MKKTDEEMQNELDVFEKEVDERNTDTSQITITSEVRDEVCEKSTDVTYCEDDHLNNKNLLKGLVEYNRR